MFRKKSAWCKPGGILCNLSKLDKSNIASSVLVFDNVFNNSWTFTIMLDTLMSGGSWNESKSETGGMIGHYLVCVYIENGRHNVKFCCYYILKNSWKFAITLNAV